MSKARKTVLIGLIMSLAVVTHANAADANPWQEFYYRAPVIEIVDPMVQLVGSTEDGETTLAIGLDDVALFTGHICPAIASAYMMTKAALDALYPDGTPERGQIRVAASAPACMLDVPSFITGARGEWGRGEVNANDLVIDPSLKPADAPGKVLVFLRKDTGDAVRAHVNPRTLMTPNQKNRFHAFHAKVLNGTATAAEKTKYWAEIQSIVRTVLLDTPGDVFTITPVDGYTFPVVAERHDHHHH